MLIASNRKCMLKTLRLIKKEKKENMQINIYRKKQE